MRLSKTLVSGAVALAALALAGASPALARGEAVADTITVTFTNNTDVKVKFILNGGKGATFSLKPGETKSYTQVVDGGVQPTIRIYQADGGTLSFTTEDGGDYSIMADDQGKIKNFYK